MCPDHGGISNYGGIIPPWSSPDPTNLGPDSRSPESRGPDSSLMHDLITKLFFYTTFILI